MNVKRTIKNYFEHTKGYSTIRFILEMSVVAFILKVFFVMITVPVFSMLGLNTEMNLELEKSFLDDPLLLAVVLIMIFAAFETITSQMFILWLGKKITKDTSFRILLSSIIFALLHVEPLLMAAVFPIGIILAWAYLLYREKGVWSALWVTTAIHVVHNLFALWLVSLG
jgi:membrane protease YdiL (CAAX protease family)